jgi:hypothetical protein
MAPHHCVSSSHISLHGCIWLSSVKFDSRKVTKNCCQRQHSHHSNTAVAWIDSMALTTHNLHSNRLHHSTTMPQSKADDTTHHAATISYNRSPTLIRASSSRFPSSPFCTCLAWFLAFVVPSLFYIGPSLLLLPPLLYFYVSTKASLVAAAVNVFLVAYPHKPWPRFRSIFQLWYSLFDFHHNLNLNGNGMTEPATLTEKESQSLLICAMHPHGVIPI